MNFTGRWEADLERCTLLGPVPRELVATIEDSGLEIVLEILSTQSDGPQNHTSLRFSSAGSESSTYIGGIEVRTRAWRETDQLVVESKIRRAGRDYMFRDYWSLSGDGQTLTMEHRDDDLMGQITILQKMPREAGSPQ